jgi:hypothetical protein
VNHADLFRCCWGTPVERERQRRINLALWAYAYEVANEPMVSDAQFDTVASRSDPTIITGRLDQWWQQNFSPSTGQWIHAHPELNQVAALHRRITAL